MQKVCRAFLLCALHSVSLLSFCSYALLSSTVRPCSLIRQFLFLFVDYRCSSLLFPATLSYLRNLLTQ
ncbi:hypothetical protein J3R30DRAFT_3465474 [Lentinula aciculospora]|uniref:Uncharacterized protein n=1 Tax=Lentinula aciculospora TaxID=153920 RepID=A0A9W9DRG6_9AGAR|nr:hypothetical protein J3R30DRAFT_3465474 [Lentinula aciculospora]